MSSLSLSLSNNKILGVIVAGASVAGAIITYKAYKNTQQHRKIEQENLALEKKIKQLELASKLTEAELTNRRS